MATRKAPDPFEALSAERALGGILAMLVAARDDPHADPADKRKTEVILADAGLTATEIAALVGKKVDAVRKTLQRAR